MSNEVGKGLVFNIQKFSLQDGPGIRTTVFMKGCPLNCRWCSNPESQRKDPEIMTFDMKCVKCGKCVEICPIGAISFIEGDRTVDWNRCDLCLECARVCLAGGMEQVGRYMTVGEVVEEVEKDVPFYMNSGGGMTISGGEPLFQYNFVREVFRQCKEKNIHTALDTSGYAEWDVMREVLPYVDLLLYDIKHMDAEMHTEGVGKPNDLIIDNARRIAGKVRTWLRFPVIPQYNDSYPNVERVAQFASDLKVEKVSLLPYHNWGEQKYGRLGRRYPAEGTPVPDEDHMQELKKIVESYGLNVTIGR